MLVDLLIIIMAVSAVYRGREIGFIRQACSTVGFFGGLFLGAWLQPHIISDTLNPTARSLLTLFVTLGCALAFLMVGEYVGIRLKRRLALHPAEHLDTSFGAALNVVTLLISAWLVAAIISSMPLPSAQTAIKNSRIVAELNKLLPAAPTVIASLGKIIDPNGFPQVFTGSEPAPHGLATLPSSSELQPAVTRDRASVVKVQSQGCGGIVDGSGFIVGDGLVATNAHVVAGIRQPYVQDDNGLHRATTIWFDPNLDLAVLKTTNLAGDKLNLSSRLSASGTPAAVLGYPGGGPFTANTAAVLDSFTAVGRNIYGRGQTRRDVYEVQADIIPGNSGGPLITKDGSVIGVIFAESTSYQHVGYALTSASVIPAINQASASQRPVSTGNCTD
jgi:S1-C subfamily serine protease